MQRYTDSKNNIDNETLKRVKKGICEIAYTFQLSLTELKNNKNITELASQYNISLDSIEIQLNKNRSEFNLGYIYSYSL